ncbi:MAG: hypothetical protein WD556_07115 [Actinomycetota bacterium]
MADERARRIENYERQFRRAGLPNLIEDYSPSEDIFTRALPFFGLVFVLELLNALNFEYAVWANVLFFAGAVAIAVVALGMANRARGRAFLSRPERVGVPELTVFVVVPALLPLVFGWQWRSALVTLAAQICIVGIAYAVIGLGLFSIVRWAGARFVEQLEASLQLLVKAVPLLLFFALVMFFTTEIWQVFTSAAAARYWTAIALFVLLGLGFLWVRIPASVRDLEREVGLGDRPLRPRARINVAVVILVSQCLQILFVIAAVWLFFVILGALLVTADVREGWLLVEDDVVLLVPFIGDGDVAVTGQLLRVATGVAAFVGLYYAVQMLVDAAYRDQFIDRVTDQMRDTFAARNDYLRLLAAGAPPNRR